MAKCGCGHSPENCTCKPSCKCGCNVRKSLAFERHAAYLDQAWRTLQDSVILKTSPAQRRKRLRRGRTQGAVPLDRPPTQEPLTEEPSTTPPPMKRNTLEVEVPRPPTGPTGPTHMRNVAPLTDEEKVSQKDMHARMAERAEQAAIERKIRELGGGGGDDDDEGSE